MSIRFRPALVIDDSGVMRTVLTDMLKRVGCREVYTAKNANQGIDMYQALKPGLVLLDITMPEVPGTKVATHILREDPNAKVIVVTAVSRDVDLVESVISLGVYDYLRKPVKQADLAAVLDRIDQEAAQAAAPPETVAPEPGDEE